MWVCVCQDVTRRHTGGNALKEPILSLWFLGWVCKHKLRQTWSFQRDSLEVWGFNHALPQDTKWGAYTKKGQLPSGDACARCLLLTRQAFGTETWEAIKLKSATSDAFKQDFMKITEVAAGQRARDFVPMSFDAQKTSGYCVERLYKFIAVGDFMKEFECQPSDLGPSVIASLSVSMSRSLTSLCLSISLSIWLSLSLSTESTNLHPSPSFSGILQIGVAGMCVNHCYSSNCEQQMWDTSFGSGSQFQRHLLHIAWIHNTKDPTLSALQHSSIAYRF